MFKELQQENEELKRRLGGGGGRTVMTGNVISASNGQLSGRAGHRSPFGGGTQLVSPAALPAFLQPTSGVSQGDACMQLDRSATLKYFPAGTTPVFFNLTCRSPQFSSTSPSLSSPLHCPAQAHVS